MKTCLQCGAEFKPYRDWQKFCPGSECKKRHEDAERERIKMLANKAAGKNLAAVALGRRRMEFLTPAERSAISRKAHAAKQLRNLVTAEERELADTLAALAKAIKQGRVELLHQQAESADGYQALNMALRKRESA